MVSYHNNTLSHVKLNIIINYCFKKTRTLSCETRVEEVGFEVCPKRCNRETVSYMKGERVPKDCGIVTEGIRECLIDL